MAAGEARIARPVAVLTPRVDHDAPLGPWPRGTPGSTSKHPPRNEARAQLARLTGVDLVAVPGLAASIAPTILSAVGTARPQCPPVTHRCSWVGLAPHHDIAGGRVWRSRTLTVVRRATHALRQAAQAVARSASAFGASCRARRARLGPPPATVATAHQLARVVDHRLQDRQPFTDESAVTEERQRRERALQQLSRRAHKLGDT
jgi:transposase